MNDSEINQYKCDPFNGIYILSAFALGAFFAHFVSMAVLHESFSEIDKAGLDFCLVSEVSTNE